ncbi:hypothetical protein LWI29_036928 [Acer saccharum]|uniref:Uncharacterized protein n=1 Tax=Acer saccharum TaxID=4024 RepID=A0AA39VU27_ACESA|nr:hypothetical protein LWI29_036928 [Acer saccharum]
MLFTKNSNPPPAEAKARGKDGRLGEGHGMKTKSSKYKVSWIIEEETSKIIDLGTALDFYFYDKEGRLADVIAKAISELKGAKLKTANK